MATFKEFILAPCIPVGVFIGFVTVLGSVPLIKDIFSEIPHKKVLRQAASEITTAQKRINDVMSNEMDAPAGTESLYRPVYTFGEKTMHILYSDGTIGEALPQSMAKCDKGDTSCEGPAIAFHKIAETLGKTYHAIDDAKGIDRLIFVPAPQDRPMAISNAAPKDPGKAQVIPKTSAHKI